jgi:hypothetical protein
MACAAACLIAAPHYLRNWIVLGTPFYPPPPVLWRFFPAKYLSADVIQNFQPYILQRGEGLGRGFGAFLLLPFQLTFHTSNFHGAGGIGISALALGPIGLILARRDAFAKALGLLGLLLTALWFVTQQESRFLIHVYVIGAVFAVTGWRFVSAAGSRHLRVLACTVVAVSLAYGIFMIWRARREEVHAVFSAPYAEARREREIPFAESFAYINNETTVKRVLILDRSVPPFYSDKPYVKPVGQWGERTLPGAPDDQEALTLLRELNVSHVLDVESSAAPFQVENGMPGLVLVLEENKQRVYRVE